MAKAELEKNVFEFDGKKFNILSKVVKFERMKLMSIPLEINRFKSLEVKTIVILIRF